MKLVLLGTRLKKISEKKGIT